jgi:hypothetical protein
LEVKIQNRGEEFERASQKRRETIERQEDVVVEVVEGIDKLCLVCPDCRDERCHNPRGDEDVRRMACVN